MRFFLGFSMKAIDLFPVCYEKKFRRIESVQAPEIEIAGFAKDKISKSSKIFFEFSSGPSFRQSGISILDKPYFKFSDSFWHSLLPGDYFLRFSIIDSKTKVVKKDQVLVKKIGRG
jgi:hypothetical protein